MRDDYAEHIDFGKAGLLLHIVEKCAGHSGKLGSLSNAAMTGLMNMNEEIKAAAAEAEKERLAQEGLDRAAAEETVSDQEEHAADLKPSVFPRDSQTATIADANIDRRL